MNTSKKREEADVDVDTIIVALTDGIGAFLGRQARSSYYELADRLSELKRYQKHSQRLRQEIVDVLAIAIVYGQVVCPLESGGSFVEIARRAGASHVRMGSDELGKAWVGSAYRCISCFNSLLAKYGIPKDTLSFSDLADFVDKVHSLDRRRRRLNDSVGRP